jgi:hypothetical protein
MAEEKIAIPASISSAELAALEVVARVYFDLLEIVLPLQSDPTRLEAMKQLSAFKNRCQNVERQEQASKEALILLDVPFSEFIVVTTAIEAYEYMDRIHCLPAIVSDLTSIEVIALTRSFQRRMISNLSNHEFSKMTG